MGNPIVWFEILGPEPATAATFYSELFGWHTQTVEGGYVLIDTHAGAGMNGGIGNPADGGKPGSVFYVGDPDIQALLDKAIGMGAKTQMPVTTIPDMVTYGSFTDPWGNLVGLMKHEADDAMVSAGTNAPVDWIELSTTEPALAWDFYRELFGWTIEGDMSGEGGGPVHASVDTGAPYGARGGIGSSRTGEPGLEAYAKVDDMATYLARAQTLGATVVMPAMKVDEHTEIAMFTDPQGTVFGLYASVD